MSVNNNNNNEIKTCDKFYRSNKRREEKMNKKVTELLLPLKNINYNNYQSFNKPIKQLKK